MRHSLILLIITFALSGCQTGIKENVVEPRGEFLEIDTSPSATAIKELKKGNVDYVLSTPGEFSPPVLYELSDQLFRIGRKDEAAFWFYLGQLRATSDANKSLDISSRQAIGILNENYGTRINQYAFQNIEFLKKTITKVIEEDKQMPRNYDPRWIALHGMDVFMKERIAFQPIENWKRINEDTREDYLSEFRQALEFLDTINR